MKKYIDPAKLPQLFREGTDENGDALVSLSEVRKALSLATVETDGEEPATRSARHVRGEWKQDFDGESYCSVCGAFVNEEKKDCPVCGAKMDGEATERCNECAHFLGCECFSGMTCDEFVRKEERKQ